MNFKNMFMATNIKKGSKFIVVYKQNTVRPFSNFNPTKSDVGINKYIPQIRGYANPAGAPGSGAGRGGGAGGSIRESGGGLGQYGAANEEGYFFNKQREQLQKLKKNQKKEEKPLDISQKEEKP